MFMIRTKTRISVNAFKAKKHPFSTEVYSKIKSERTVMRDYKLMLSLELITIKDEQMVPNIDLMKKFVEGAE